MTYPGLMTQGKIWIQNTGRAEAVPVVIENMAKDTAPLRVEVLGTTTVALASGVVLQAQTRAARQQWEHRSITVALVRSGRGYGARQCGRGRAGGRRRAAGRSGQHGRPVEATARRNVSSSS